MPDMADQRIEKLAQVLVDYSLRLQKGDIFLLRAETAAEPLVREVFRRAVQLGAYPITRIGLPGLEEIFLKEAPEESLDWVSPLEAYESEQMTAYLTITASANTQELSGVDPARLARIRKSHTALQQRRMVRLFSDPPEVRWCGTLFPVQSSAQDAHMSLADYKDFVYHAMFLDQDDPVAAWQALSARQNRYCQTLSAHEAFRVEAGDTDIRFQTQGRKWINADGHLNFPDGEVFTGPLETSVQGHIRFTYPTVYAGREAEDVQLWFEDGLVTRWEARRGKELLDELFAMDEGARRLGEFAIGCNDAIRTFSKNILFDEKIGGTCHFAVGAGIPMTGGVNQSALHWDMVRDLRSGGRISADGEVIHENGLWKL